MSGQQHLDIVVAGYDAIVAGEASMARAVWPATTVSLICGELVTVPIDAFEG